MSRRRAPLVMALALAAPIALFAYQHAGAPAAKKGSATAMKGMDMKGGAMTDAQKIASAEGAAPALIAKGAMIMDWPEKDGAPMRHLRAGTNGWLCMPQGPMPSMPAMCMDKQWQGWADAYVKKAPPQTVGAGVAYMLGGDNGASNTDPYATGPTATNDWVVAPAHIMLLFADSKLLDSFPTDPKTGGPWVMWKGTPYAHVMVPTSKTQAAKMGAK